MKYIKVFIASSEELEIERLRFSDMIQHLNQILRPRGIQIDPVKWEYLDASMGPLHKQEEYNRELKQCELCLVLYWTKFGEYTKSELDTAYQELCAGRNPKKLYVYFKEAQEMTPELKAFKDSFATNYGHFFCRFENVDTMKLNFLLQFEAYQNTTQTEPLLKVRNAKIELDGKPLLDLPNIPFAGNNPDYQQLLKDIEKAQARVLKYPEENEFRQELHDLQERCRAMEESLLDTAKLITRLSSTVQSARLTEAVRLFEMGDNRGANAVLNLDEITQDAKTNLARLKAGMEIVKEAQQALEINIEEYRTKIKILQNTMESGWVDKVIEVYANAVEIARDHIAPEKLAELLEDYAEFLRQNVQYHLIGTLYKEALTLYRQLAQQDPQTYDSKVAYTLNHSAILHTELECYEEAAQEYQEALEIYHRLAPNHPQVYEYNEALTLNNLAILHHNLHQYKEAEKEYREACYLLNRLAPLNTLSEKDALTMPLNNLAILHYDQERYDEAEREYEEVLKIYRELALKNPQKYDGCVARTLNNLACLHTKLQHFEKSEKEHLEALEIYQQLAQKNPQAFNKEVARSLHNLAHTHHRLHRYQEAEKHYQEALAIRRKLAQQNAMAFDSDVAETLGKMALLHEMEQRYEEAEREYQETLKIYRNLAQQNPQRYEFVLARTLYNMATQYSSLQQYEEAKNKHQEALEIYRRLAQQAPQAFESKLAETLNDLAVANINLLQHEEAEKAFKESLDIFCKLATKNPQKYERYKAIALHNTAYVHKELHRYDEARREFEGALEIYRRLAQQDPQTYENILTQVMDDLTELNGN